MPIRIGGRPDSSFADPLGLLTDCHRRIERFLRVLVRVAERAGSPLGVEERSALETALRYFREAAPKHTADEEESLFPRLRARQDGAVSELLARVEALEREHIRAEKGHQEVDRLGRAWLEKGALAPEEAARLRVLLAELEQLYRSHIAVEDDEVFPAAAKVLAAEERRAIGREMAARRGFSAEQ